MSTDSVVRTSFDVEDRGLVPGRDLLQILRAKVGFFAYLFRKSEELTRAQDREKARGAGFQSHVSKPVDPSELAAAVSDLIRATRASGHDESSPV